MTQTALEQGLNTDDAAEVLDCAPATLAKKRVIGGGPTYVKVGARVIYMPSDLREYIARNRRETTSQQTQK